MTRTDPTAFQNIIATRNPVIQAVASDARALILELLPQAYEIVWERQGTVGYGTGPKKMTEHFSWIATANKHVTLGFFYGAELEDPTGLLEGTGKKMRHVKLRGASDVQAPAVRALLIAAMSHRVPPPRPLEGG